MRAIVVDDSRATRAMLVRILGGLGFDTVQAADGQAALDALDEHGPVELALVDWNMPVLDGLGFVRAARGRSDLDAMRIVMVTTEGDTQRMVEALEAGADEYAMKPFTPAVIREKLQLIGIAA